MKTLKEFEYDLWTTEEDSVKHYWTRVKATGEVSEVTHEVMKFLRNEEKQMRREIESTIGHGGSDLSYNTIPVDDEDSIWLWDPNSMEDTILANAQLEELRASLTPAQLSVFEECIMGGKLQPIYAAEHGVTQQLVSKRLAFIRKKAKKIFGEGCF